MKPLLITSGEPAGIGPDLCLALIGSPLPLVVLADKDLLHARAKQLGVELHINDYREGDEITNAPNHLTVLPLSCIETPIAGQLNVANSSYVLQMLEIAAQKSLSGEFSAIITAPVHKGIINQLGIDFTGHTEYFADFFKVERVVMMLASQTMRVALVTTHVPLKDVSANLTADKLKEVILILNNSLKKDFGISNPKIFVAGLNPHAGENGYLGREEIEVITPVLLELQQGGLNIEGPLPADTMFMEKNLKTSDAFLAMYHDQGLPVLKYADFGSAVNVTLGLPVVRTSVDHGTALDLAGTNRSDVRSLLAAVEMAFCIAKNRG
jgi:4-hydroxythreonine-4-phosphate dehydrogenase